ncbi:MAG: hypothetical protein GOP50_00525 [Candidatus Heimdallarchaeota archaeon]|nr:hypothetical protein [Candidatus Heimdallarchaeota archaeon]
MYFEFNPPKLFLEITGNFEKDEKNFQKALKKAEKNDNINEIVEVRLFHFLLDIKLSRLDDALKSIESLEELAGEQISTQIAVKKSIIKGIIQAQLLMYENSLETLEHALKESKSLDDASLLNNIKENLSIVQALMENYTSAVKNLEQVISYAESKKDIVEVLRLKTLLGLFYFEKKNFKKSKSVFMENVELGEKIGNDILVIENLRLLSRSHFMMNEFSEASNLINKAMSLSETDSSESYRIQKAWCLLGVTELLLSDNKLLRADSNIEEAKKIFLEYRNAKGLVQNYILHSRLLIAKNRAFEAEKMIDEASKLSEKLGRRINPAELYEEIGKSLFTSFDKSQGIKFLEKAREKYDKKTAPLDYARFIARLGRFYFQSDDLSKALSMIEESLAFFKSENLKKEILPVNKLKAQIMISQDKLKEAEKIFEENILFLREMKNDVALAKNLRDLADLKNLSNRTGESINLLKESIELFEKKKAGQEQLITYCKLINFTQKIGNSQDLEQLLAPVLKLVEKVSIKGIEDTVASVYLKSGDHAYTQQDYSQAKDYYEKSYKIFKSIFDNSSLALTCMKRARAEIKLKDEETAYELLMEALRIEKEFELNIEQSIFLYELSDYLKQQLMDKVTVSQLTSDAATILELANYFKEAAKLYNISADLFFKMKQFSKTILLSNTALKLAVDLGDLEQKTYSHYLIGASSLNLDQLVLSTSFENLKLALKGYQQSENQLMIGKTTLAISEAEMLGGDLDKGVTTFNEAIEIIQKMGSAEELLNAYDILVDCYFAMGKKIRASLTLDKQIALASDKKKFPSTFQLKKFYTKQVAVNLSLNNHTNAIALVQHQLDSKLYGDSETIHRLKCELGSLLYLEGLSKDALTALREIDIRRAESSTSIRINPHDYYLSLKTMYLQYYMKIGRYSICCQMLGDIYYRKKKWEDTFNFYTLAYSIGRKEQKKLPPELTLIQSTYVSMAENKAKNAQTLVDNLGKTGMYTKTIVTGKATYPCINCLGNRSITDLIGESSQGSTKCPTCNGKGKLVQRPPLSQHL